MQRLSANIQQPVIVENKPGAGAAIGAALVKQQPADGYTLLYGDIGPFAINGALRLPGVVARPGHGEGLLSAYMRLLFWRLAPGEPVTVPVAADGTAWWISVGACIDNLLHAATLVPSLLAPHRCWQMPVLHLSIAEVVAALAARRGPERAALVTCAPDPVIERLFSRYPPLATPQAEALGFRDDGSVQALVERAVR